MTAERSLRRSLAPLAILVATVVTVSAPAVAAAPTTLPRDSGPTPRASMGMAFNPLGDVVMFGGDTADALGNLIWLGDTWTWDGAFWEPHSTGSAPLPRCCMAMAYDGARNQVVLFGGNDSSTTYGDTWIWDGTNWTEQHPVHSPLGASGNAMVYDANHRQIVMFGIAGETWVWNGTDWHQKHPRTSPVGRERLGMAYDALTGQVVLFGGDIPDACLESTCWLGDTWIWNGTNWKNMHPTPHPLARSEAGKAYDSQSQRVVLFGGSRRYNYDGDTWTWDGSIWDPVTPGDSPLPREALGMAYDGTVSRILLFGGRDGSLQADQFGDTWLWQPRLNTWEPL